ncbi:DpnII family type II restriction endonuclease [Helicobacter felis]|uniref:DpnII family type II restriction endonuclease n=1 Tax=Helicobacter felis TaxID=214 RepID=UPI001315A437|nr:DpnII family type II restriction endonuclease [Helicobacter felis]
MDKTQIVIQRNSFYFSNVEFEEKYEAEVISCLKTLLLHLQNEIRNKGCQEEVFVKFLQAHELGLEALLVLNALAHENLKRILTIARIVKDKELSELLLLSKWAGKEKGELKEWSNAKIKNLISKNKYFAKGLVNLFFKGASNPFLARTLPLFELNKLNLLKMNFEPSAMLDTLIRYRQKGSYSGSMANNPEVVLKDLLNALKIPFECGDLPLLSAHESLKKRTMDFIIPNKANPQIIIECSFLSTTTSAQGDKAKTEVSISGLIKKYYPRAEFIGFVDGIGWYVRKQDLKRMVQAYREVFTFRSDELQRFSAFIQERLKHA